MFNWMIGHWSTPKVYSISICGRPGNSLTFNVDGVYNYRYWRKVGVATIFFGEKSYVQWMIGQLKYQVYYNFNLVCVATIFFGEKSYVQLDDWPLKYTKSVFHFNLVCVATIFFGEKSYVQGMIGHWSTSDKCIPFQFGLHSYHFLRRKKLCSVGWLATEVHLTSVLHSNLR